MLKYLFLFVTAGTLLMLYVMAKTGAPLKTATTPHGILNLEFAYNSQKAAAVIGAWQPDNKIEAAIKNTQYDFIFIFFYALFLYLGCRKVAKKYNGLLQKAGLFFAACAIAAGLLDVLENFGMLATLYGHLSETMSVFTVTCSAIKWMLALSALLYLVIFGLAGLTKKNGSSMV